MKPTQVMSHVLFCSVFSLGAACTSTSTPPGSTTATAATSGTEATGGGADMNTAGSSGTASGVGTTATSAATMGSATTGGTGDPTDANAFLATFATMQDPVFLMTAASSNLLEIQLGQLATQRTSNAEVKKYAQMMVQHHTKATQDLKAVAAPLGVQMPQVMMPVHQRMLDEVSAKTGKDFDEAYMDTMEAAHKLDVAMFAVKSKAAESPAVKTFATSTLPMLRLHEQIAGEIEKKVD